jgi:hypothetical protein
MSGLANQTDATERAALPPAVVIYGLAGAVAALERARDAGLGVTLLSAPGAALHAGCGWWKALIEAARAAFPDTPCIDILDCADGSGHALAALRIGVTRLVLWPEAPGRDAIVAIAEAIGGFVLAEPPPTATPGRPRANRDKPPPTG